MKGENSGCRVIGQRNSTLFADSFDGISENLLINVVISLVILMIFLVMKKIAWICKSEAPTLYKTGWITLFYSDVYDFVSKTELQRHGSVYKPLDPNMTYCRMLWYSFVKLSKEEILERCGVDASEYLMFLKCAVQYNAINAVVVLFAVLPANLHGDMHNDRSLFVRTTMGNLDFHDSSILWVHVFAAFLLMVTCFIKIRSFSSRIKVSHRSTLAEKTVYIKELGNRPVTSERIENHFKTCLPKGEIDDIKFVYKYKRLIHLDSKLKNVEEAWILCQHVYDTEKRKVYVKERCWCCHFFCNLRCPRNLVDGRIYYAEMRENVRQQLADELNRLSTRTLRIAFVTFKEEYYALQARTALRKYSEEVSEVNWDIKKAPDPANIIWENLSRVGSNLACKTIFINTSVFFIAVFITSPTIILSSINFQVFSTKLQSQGVVIFRFLPTVIVWIFSIGIAALVTYSSDYLDFETKSGRNRSIMFKTVTFLIFTVVILPSFGLTSISAFIIWSLTQGEEEYKWGCIFLPDNGSFFVSYVMTSAFIGITIQLLRLPEIFMYALGLLMAKSEAERITIRKSCIWYFRFGLQYAHGLLIFTLVMFYSIPCPLIAPFGLVYFLFKFAVDRYNIYFTCSPARTSFRVHAMALRFMMFSLIMKDVGLFFLIYIRGGWSLVAYASHFLAWMTVLICFFSMNPCDFKFLPKALQMPHRMRLKRYEYYETEIGYPVKELYQPLALQKYSGLLLYLDKYNNPVQTGLSEMSDDAETSDSQDESNETFFSRD